MDKDPASQDRPGSSSDQTAAALLALMQAASVPGISLAIVRRGATRLFPLGVRDTATNEAVDAHTVFDAASLSKPMVAYAVMQLVEAGAFDLDVPLSAFVPPIVPDAAPVTARQVLSHTAGLPNLREKEPIAVHFPPGSRFSYSSVGFGYLQSAVEAATGEALEPLMQRLVFDPLGMRASSFAWQARFGANVALPHEDAEVLEKHRPARASASYSLQTTAADYAAFLQAVLTRQRLRDATHREWLRPHVQVPLGTAVHLGSPPLATEPDVGWALGWGREPSRDTFFQWGKIAGVRAFAMGSLAEQSAVALFTNSNRGLRLMATAARMVARGDHAAVPWLQACVWE